MKSLEDLYLRMHGGVQCGLSLCSISRIDLELLFEVSPRVLASRRPGDHAYKSVISQSNNFYLIVNIGYYMVELIPRHPSLVLLI